MCRKPIVFPSADRAGIGIQDITHPLDHPHFVVQLHYQDFAAARDLTRRQHLEYRAIPSIDARQKVGMQRAGDILHRSVLIDECRLGVLAEYPGRDAFIDRLSHDVRTGARDDEQAHVGSQIEKARQIAHWVRMTVQVGHAPLLLVPQPGNVGGDGIEPRRLQ